MSGLHGNLSHAMRDNYKEHGVEEYYRKVASTYTNPFFPGIKKVIWTLMNRMWEEEGEGSLKDLGSLKILDMAAGSGEATLCLLEWEDLASRDPSAPLHSTLLPSSHPNSRPAFIPPNALRYRHRTQSSLRDSPKESLRLETPLPHLPRMEITATDPYTAPAYVARTSRPCHPLSFAELANGHLTPLVMSPGPLEPVWDIVICSFALHLIPTQSELFALLHELSGKARWLAVISPHKKPEIKETWGWARWDVSGWKKAGDKIYTRSKGLEEEQELELEIVKDKVRLRLYRSRHVT